MLKPLLQVKQLDDIMNEKTENDAKEKARKKPSFYDGWVSKYQEISFLSQY